MRGAGTPPTPMNAGKPADTTETKMAQHLRIATSASIMRELGDYVVTDTVADIRRSVDLIRSMDGAGMTFVAGNPGVGKTTALKKVCSELGHNAIYQKAACGEGTAWNFAKAYMARFNWENSFNTLAQARTRVGNMNGSGRLLVIDEAQHLIQRNRRNNITGEAFNWVVDVAEDYNIPLVFCGDISLVNFIKSSPRMSSRMRRPVVIEQVSEGDVRAVADGSGFEAQECVRALHSISKLTGGLRNVENVLRIALAFAGNDRPNAAHLKAAIIDMKLDMRSV